MGWQRHPVAGRRAMRGVRCLRPGDGAVLVRRLCEAARETDTDIDGI